MKDEAKYNKINIVKLFGKTYKIIHKNNKIVKNVFCANFAIIFSEINTYFQSTLKFILNNMLLASFCFLLGIIILVTYGIFNVNKKIVFLIKNCIFNDVCDEHYLEFDCNEVVNFVKDHPNEIDLLVKCYKSNNIYWYQEGVDDAIKHLVSIMILCIIIIVIIFIAVKFITIFFEICKKILFNKKINIDFELPVVIEEV
jgi:hypothetical protein